jgi:GTPase-associated protein 1, N-terminal domain type 2/GTPase-associated protein 1, middle domain
MGHLHAYYTSCRHGLSGQPGFQFNAASPELSAEARRELAAAHAGYTLPRDSPPEPSPEQLAAFPVALKHRPVDGVGVVLSRTTYVGREFRGAGGEPDSGRFGNYFSHIVVGGDAAEPFGGLLPIELWDAPHWTTTEAADAALAPLGPLAPGPLDLEAAHAHLGDRRAWCAVVLDAALAALSGGPRVVLVEPDATRAAAWVAWASFALPPELARQLTFTTYDGRPRNADVHLCVTAPSCDLAFAAYELGSRVRLLHVAEEPAAEAPPSLYARVAVALADEGMEALGSAVRTLPSAADAGTLGAELAVAGRRTDLARDDELAGVLDLLAAHAARGRWEAAVAAMALPASTEDAAVLAAWARLHAAGRASVDPAAQEVVDAAVDRLLPHAGALPEGLPAVAEVTATNPSVDRLARWLEQVEQQSAAGVAQQIDGGLQLGLLGRNAALDRRLAGAIAGAVGEPSADATFERLARSPGHASIAAEVGVRLAERATGEPRALEPLRRAIAQAEVWAALERWAHEPGRGFRERFIFASLRIAKDPPTRADELATLAALATSDAERRSLAALFPGGAPGTPTEHAELLSAYRGPDGPPPADVDRALACLAAAPLADAPRSEALVRALARADPGVQSHPVVLAWGAARDASCERVDFERWAGWVRAAADPRADPAPSPAELRQLAGDAVLRMAADPGYARGLAQLAAAFGADWPSVVADALTQRLARAVTPERSIARAFEAWSVLPAGTGRLDETVLPAAVEGWSSRQLARVADELPGDAWRTRWERWLADHPPRGGLGRAVGRVLRREEQR